MPFASAGPTNTDLPRQLSDANSLGTVLGQSPTDKIGFFGNAATTAVVQPSGFAQSALARGLAAGLVATFSSTQSPSAVGANTTVESAFTVQTGTGFIVQPATTDMLVVNKPTAQAGLGMGNARISALNTVNVNFNNFSGGSITPTGSQVYQITIVRGLPTISATLSPTAVPATTVAEQQFTVAGLPAGALVQVQKPTAQTGLDIVGCRVVAANTLGITFANPTAAPITPTASEVYVVTALFGIDATSNEVNYGFNVGAVGAITAGVVISGGSTTLTGLLATDAVVGLFKPTPQAAATNVATPIYGVPTANTLTLYYLGTGTGGTPTSSEVYTVKTLRLAPTAPLVVYSQTLTPVSVAANTTAEQTFTVTGLLAGTQVLVNKPSATAGLGIVGVRVSALNTLAVTYANVTAAAIVPPAETYLIGNFQQLAPGAGNSVWQAAVAVVQGGATLMNSIRAAMVSLGLIAGA